MAICDGSDRAWYRPVPGESDMLAIGIDRDLSLASVQTANGRDELPVEGCADGEPLCVTFPVSMALNFDGPGTWETSAHFCTRKSVSAQAQSVVCADKEGGWKTAFRYTAQKGVVGFTRTHVLRGDYPYALTSDCGLFSESGG